MVETAMVCVRFEGDDLALLDAVIAHERLRRSDVIRRAVRAYAAQHEITAVPARRKKKPKP